MIQDQATPPHEIAVPLYEQGKPAGEIGAALLASGMDQTAVEAYMSGLLLAIVRFDEGRSAAEVWSALVSSGMDHAAAEMLVKKLLELRRRQLDERRREEEHLGSGFCKECYRESSGETPGNIRSINGVGLMFHGGARACKACRSEVRILWLVFFIFPVIPLGSYRYREVGDTSALGFGGKFLARRTRMRLGQVVTHYVAALGVCVLLFFVLVLARRLGH